ncbi:MAG: Smr/MutS family protein [Lachnospiraceae bacterium]|nr:Smr/MutS family protein [Lachnospiraceae bacterium]
MSGPFVDIDLHGCTQEQAQRIIDRALKNAGPEVYQIRLVHGYHRGTSLMQFIRDWYKYEAKVKRIIPGDNPGVTILVLKELY